MALIVLSFNYFFTMFIYKIKVEKIKCNVSLKCMNERQNLNRHCSLLFPSFSPIMPSVYRASVRLPCISAATVHQCGYCASVRLPCISAATVRATVHRTRPPLTNTAPCLITLPAIIPLIISRATKSRNYHPNTALS